MFIVFGDSSGWYCCTADNIVVDSEHWCMTKYRDDEWLEMVWSFGADEIPEGFMGLYEKMVQKIKEAQ